MTLRLLKPGLHTMLADFGRPRTRSLGVPLGGAADHASLALGNRLLGNPPDTVALEITLAGPTVQAGCNLACVLYGAPFALDSDRQPLLHGKTFTLHAGEELRIGGTPQGMRAYFCVEGGFNVPRILDSRSSLAPLRGGEVLACSPSTTPARYYIQHPFASFADRKIVRVLDGAQADWFLGHEFYTQELTISPSSNRMGLRLQGSPLTLPPRELVSEPVCPGAVQVVRDGQCIILGVDGQTIGGYPKIAQVISADLDLLGQLRPGERIRFERVNLEEAQLLYEQHQQELAAWLSSEPSLPD